MNFLTLNIYLQTLLILEYTSFVSVNSSNIGSYSLSTYNFNTLDQVSYPLNTIFPSTAQKISVIVFIRSEMNADEAAFNV